MVTWLRARASFIQPESSLPLASRLQTRTKASAVSKGVLVSYPLKRAFVGSLGVLALTIGPASGQSSVSAGQSCQGRHGHE